MDIGLYVAGNNLSVDQRTIIDSDGNVRVTNDIEQDLESDEVVLANSPVDSEIKNTSASFVDENTNIQDITDDVENVIAALEEGQDPTNLGDEVATASGSLIGSSPSSIEAIVRTAGETSPHTEFATQAIFNELGLSKSQSLTLIEQFRAFQQFPTLTDANQSPLADNQSVVTDEDSAVSGQIFATDPNPQDSLSFIITSSPTNGIVSVNPVSGIWIYAPNTNFDGADSFEITVDDGNGGTATAIVNVEVTPIPEVSLTGPSQVNEGDAVIYVATFDKASTQDTQINLSLSLNSAELGDLSSITVTTADGLILEVGSDGTVNVPAGVTSLNISVGTTGDDVFEGSEDFQLGLTSRFGTVGSGELTTIIQDDDTPALSISSESVVEGGAAVFDVELSNKVDGDVTYAFTLNVNGQSAEWSDFASNPLSIRYQIDGVTYSAAANNDGSYTIAGNATDIQVSVQTQDDSIFEGSESFTLSANANATVGGDSFNLTDSGTGTIKDDRDRANNTDTPTLNVSSESVVEGDAAVFDVELSNDVDGDVTYVFTLNVNGQSAEWADFASNPLSVRYQIDGVTYSAAANNDGSYTIAGSATDIQVSVQTQDDSIFEGSESFTLSTNASATVGGDSFNLTDSGTGTIKDDRDGANNADTPALSVSSESVVEGDAAVFDVELSNKVDGDVTYAFSLNVNGQSAEWADFASNPLSVRYQIDGVTYSAAANNDGSYTIAGNATDIQVSVQTQDDSIFEGLETFTLDANASANVGGDGFNLTDSGIGLIEDVDIPFVSVSEGEIVSEGSAAEFTVSLSKNTAEAVTVNLALFHLDTDSADITTMEAAYQDGEGWQALSLAPNGDITLPAGMTQVRVTIQTTDDNAQPVYEGAERFELTVTGVNGAQGLASSVSTIVDDGSVGSDDDRPIIKSISEVTVAEGSDATFNVTLSSESNTDTHVILELKERKASSPEDYDGSFVTVTYGDPQQGQTLPILNGLFEFDLLAGETDFSVVVKTVDDEVSENNETFLLAARTEYQSNQVSAKATIEDNEKPVIDLDGSQYQIEFVSEDAGYRNVFGYYVYDPESETQQLQILMSDSHDSRQSGFEPVFATLGSLDNVEYFLIADGAGLVDSVTAEANFEVDADGRLIINGNIQSNAKVLLSHDEASLMRTSVNDNGDTIINFDDQIDHAHDDNDYDDLVIKIAKQDTHIDYSTDFVEGDGAVSIVDTDADIFDDKDSIQSMHVLLNKVYEGDQLTWSTMSGFTVNQTKTATGLSLLITSNVSGGVSAAEFEAFLEGIKYENISENPDETVREIDVYVTDSYGQSSETATTTITVSKVADLIVEQNSVGIEDGDLALNVTVPLGSSVADVVLNNLPQGVVLKSGNDLVPITNGEARLTSQQLSQLTITPPNDSDENFIVNVNGYAFSNELIEEYVINVQVDAVTDVPVITVTEPEQISLHHFDSINLGNSSWRGNVTSSELIQADGVEGIWGTDNRNSYNEVGKETVYRGGVLDNTNHVYEIEGRNGDGQLFTQFNAEAGQFYTLSFDVVARRVNDSPMTVFLEDESGNREVLFEYTDQQSLHWQTESINFQTLSDGDYKVVFESETSSNSYGALLDDIRLEKTDNIGFENNYIPLSDILVSLSDSDGSETLSLILNGLPEGTMIRDGNGNSTNVVATIDGKNSVDLSSWNNDLTGLEVYVFGEGVYPLEFIVSAQDNAPANTESVSKVVNLTVLPSFMTYEFESGSHGNDVITGNDDHEVIVGDVQGIQIIAGQDYNIAFVLDTFGSMRETVGNAKSEILEVFDQLHSTVNSGDNTGNVNILLTEFSTNTGVTISVDLNSPTARVDFITQLSDIEDSGSGYTNYEASFDATIEWFDASTNTQAENITYFITDGNPNYIQRSKIGENEFDELVLDFDTSTKNLVTLENILPPDYILGTSVTYKGQEIISNSGMVKSPLTGVSLGNLTNSNGLRYSDSNLITTQTRHIYQLLALISSVDAIGIGDSINAATLLQYDTNGAVTSNINVDQLAETILGKEIPLKQGEDHISGGLGDDILFGDLINFDSIDGQGISALQKHVAAETGSPLADVSAEDVNHFVRQNFNDFDVSHIGDQNDVLSGGSGDDILFGQGGDDILDGGSGNDILLGGEGDDILIGGLGNDILSGGVGHDEFIWRNGHLDSGVDVITDFDVSEDKINISDLLIAGETIEDLLSDISANAIDNNIELTIQRNSGQTSQSIMLDNVVDQFSGLDISYGSITGNDLTSLLNGIIMMQD